MGSGKARKLRLSPVQREILWMLDEAGGEDIQTVLTTLQSQFAAMKPEALLATVDEALEELYQIGLVSLSQAYQTAQGQWVYVPFNRESTEPSIKELALWNHKDNYWMLDPAKTGNHLIQLILTEDGHKAVRS